MLVSAGGAAVLRKGAPQRGSFLPRLYGSADKGIRGKRALVWLK